MANKQDVFNAFYQGFCTALCNMGGAGFTDASILDGMEHEEIKEFIDSEEGEFYRHLFTFDENGRAWPAL